MRITPLDVRKQEFRRTVRGFDCDEVRAFMTTLADEYEIVLVDNKQLREKMIVQEQEIAKYQSMERTLRDTLMTAEKLMQETRENANKEGGLILQDAKLQGKEILQEYRRRAEDLRRELDTLCKEKERYLGRFKSLAESQIQFIETHRTDFKDLDDRLAGIVDSVIEGVNDSENEAESEKETAVESIVDAMIQPKTTATAEPFEAPAPAFAPTASASNEDVWRNYNPAQTRQREQEIPAATPAEVPAVPTADPFGEPENIVPAAAAAHLLETLQNAIPDQSDEQAPAPSWEPPRQTHAPEQTESQEQASNNEIWQGGATREHPYFPQENPQQNREETSEKDENEEKEPKREDIFTETMNI